MQAILKVGTLLMLALLTPRMSIAVPTFDSFDQQPVLAATEQAGAYFVDRYPPAVFESAPFQGDNRLHVQISQADSQPNRPPAFSSSFYNTQGRDYLHPDAVTVQIDLHVGSDWDVNLRRADIWAVGVDGSNAVSKYAILGVTSQGGLRFRVFDDSIGFVNLSYPISTNRWYRLTVSLTCTSIQYRIDGNLVYTDSNLNGTASFRTSDIQAFNFGDTTYDIYWDNFQTDPLPNGCFCTPGGDDDADGIPNSVESTNNFCRDSDLDGVPDYLDRDSDNDGIPDSRECGQAICPDTDGDGTKDFLDLDSDADGLFDVIEGGGYTLDADKNGRLDTFTDTNLDGLDDTLALNPLPIPDSDGNGVPDFRQASFVLQDRFYFVWNGFLNQSNIAVFINKLPSANARVQIELLDIDGHVRSQSGFQLAPHQEFDFPINQLEGFQADSYGLVRVSFSPPGAIDGHTALYRFGTSDLEYELIREHQNSIRGVSYASFNTIQPSRRPVDQQNLVIHWLQLSNHDLNSWKSFTVNRYLSGGSLLESRRLSIPPQGRRDIQAGHTDSVQGRVGTVEVIPDDPSAAYGGELFRTGSNAPTGVQPTRFDFGIADKLEPGTVLPQYVSVSRGAGGVNYLELTNLSNVRDDIAVEVDSNFGSQLLFTSYSLEPRQQIHLDLSQVLHSGEAGYARIASANQHAVLVKSSVYFFKPDGQVADAYSAPGRTLVSGQGFSVYNVFLNQQNWLKLFNTSNAQVSAFVDAYDLNGVLLGTRTLLLDPHSGQDLELKLSLFFPLGTDTYGTIVVRTPAADALAADLLRIRNSALGPYVDLAKILSFR